MAQQPPPRKPPVPSATREIVIEVTQNTNSVADEKRLISGNQTPYPVLRVLEGEDSGKVLVIKEPGETEIGRAALGGLVLNAGDSSRRHASITWGPEGEFTLRDLGSSNGTFVKDGRRLPKDGVTALRPGERFQIGASTILSLAMVPYDEAIALEKAAMSRYLDPETGVATTAVLEETHQRELSFLVRNPLETFGFMLVSIHSTGATFSPAAVRDTAAKLSSVLRKDAFIGVLPARGDAARFGIVVTRADVTALQKIAERMNSKAGDSIAIVAALIHGKWSDATFDNLVAFCSARLKSGILEGKKTQVVEYAPQR